MGSGIVLARHGETTYNAERRFQGQLPVPLTERGRAQARELARIAAERGGWRALWSSALARARETAGIVGVELGLETRVEPRLNEADCGDWTSRPFAAIEAEDPEGYRRFKDGDPQFAFPGGESLAGQTERVLAGLEAIATGPTPALVICHQGVIRRALTARGADAGARTAPIANGTLVELP